MAQKGKRFREATKLVKSDTLYSVQEAAELIGKLPKPKFDESVDLAINLGVNPKKAEENVRGTVALPHGTGKTMRVAAVCKGEKAKEAEAAGADFIGAEDLVQKIQEGWMDFDALVATPDVMALVGRVGKQLGPRGLMPNPKVGTVTFDVGSAVREAKGGKIEYRVEKAGIVHARVGKRSFSEKALAENANALIHALVRAKPSTAKGTYLRSISMSSTMGPGVKIDTAQYMSTTEEA